MSAAETPRPFTSPSVEQIAGELKAVVDQLASEPPVDVMATLWNEFEEIAGAFKLRLLGFEVRRGIDS